MFIDTNEFNFFLDGYPSEEMDNKVLFSVGIKF